MEPREPEPVKLVASIFTGETELFAEVLRRLQERFGPVDMLSEPMDFDHTDYYEEEFGPALVRRLASFDRLIRPEELPAIKLYTNSLEQEYLTEDGRRRVNIDPGYVSLERFVLATCKNHYHRIYLGRGVYADLTLVYRKGEYRPLEWTYPDYSEPHMRALIKQIRLRYAYRIGKGKRRV